MGYSSPRSAKFSKPESHLSNFGYDDPYLLDELDRDSVVINQEASWDTGTKGFGAAISSTVILLSEIKSKQFDLGTAEATSDAAVFLRPQPIVVEIFNAAVKEWRTDCRNNSNMNKILLHKAHLKIIGLGKQANPLILEDLRTGGGPWFVALAAINDTNPIKNEHRGNLKLMRQDWIEWGQREGYIRG